MARAAGIAIVYADSPEYPAIADVAGDFVYARLESGVDEEPTGYPLAALDRWADAAWCWAKGGAPEGLPYMAEPAPKTPRETFIFFIHGGKVRAPHAAMALIDRVRR